MDGGPHEAAVSFKSHCPSELPEARSVQNKLVEKSRCRIQPSRQALVAVAYKLTSLLLMKPCKTAQEMNTHIYVYMFIYIYIHTHRGRKRERERLIETQIYR